MPFLMEGATVALFGGLLGTAFNILLLLLLHLLMPREVLLRYWKEPHFRPFELGMFTGSWLAPMRTVMLTWLLAFPRFGRSRGVTEAHLLTPRWYRTASRVFCLSALTCAALVGTSLVGVVLDMWLGGQDTTLRTQMTVGLLVFLGGIGGVAIHLRRTKRKNAEPTIRQPRSRTAHRR